MPSLKDDPRYPEPKACSSTANLLGWQLVRKEPVNRRIRVCVFSSHPLLLSECERLLSRQAFHLIARRVESNQIADPEQLSVPRASVYVVEAHAHRQVADALVAAIVERYPVARVLVVAERFTESNAFSLLRLGVKGLVRYSEVVPNLPRVLREVAGGGFWVPRSLLSRFVDSALNAAVRPRYVPATAHLSRREGEVIELVLQNLSNKEIVAIQPEEGNPPLFCVHALGGGALYYRDLGRYLDPDQPLHGLQPQGLDGRSAPHTRLEDMAAHYIKEILEI